MNFKKIGMTLAITFGVTGIGTAINIPFASAKTPTFPTHMRGTWYGYVDGKFDTIKITTHTFRRYGYTIPASKLDLLVYKAPHYHTQYTPKMKHTTGQFDFFSQGKVRWHGLHYYALFEDNSDVYTHHKIKHKFRVPKGY